MSRKVLVVDDEKLIVKGLRFSLEQDGMEVDCAYDGEEALEKAKAGEYDIILLDLMLPKMDVLEVCQQIPEFYNVRIIMLTAKGEDMDKILGLEYGADDYITKPFGNQELLARIRTALRHRRQPMGAETKTPMYHAGQLKIEFDKRRVFLGEEEIRLTQIEYKLVSLLAENAGKVITYESIIKDIWGPHADTNNRILRVNMANIRRKIEENPAVPKYVFTEVGVGYRMLENELNS